MKHVVYVFPGRCTLIHDGHANNHEGAFHLRVHCLKYASLIASIWHQVADDTRS